MSVIRKQYYRHYRDVPTYVWDICPRFHPSTDPYLVSPDDSSFQVHVPSLQSLQQMRNLLGPLQIWSGYRSPIYNARTRGAAPNSQHKLSIAFDIPFKQYHPLDVEQAAREAGFTGIGRYNTFLHVDRGPTRLWYGSQKAKDMWRELTQPVDLTIIL